MRRFNLFLIFGAPIEAKSYVLNRMKQGTFQTLQALAGLAGDSKWCSWGEGLSYTRLFVGTQAENIRDVGSICETHKVQSKVQTRTITGTVHVLSWQVN